MKKFIKWSEWSIGTKILITFLGLSVLSTVAIGFLALVNMRHLGDYALQSSASLGESAIQDSTAHLNKLGEETVTQIAKGIAKQAEMYLEAHPMTMAEMRDDKELRNIVVQPVGTTGYTTLIDSGNYTIIIHKYPGQEKDLSPLKSILPSFWAILEASANENPTLGYYDWQEVDGSIREKFAAIVPVRIAGRAALTLWATTYIEEFSAPAEQTKNEIEAAISDSEKYINNNVINVQNGFILMFAVFIMTVIALSLLLARVITSPILALKHGAEVLGRGELDYKLEVKSHDELGDLADSFNKMGAALKRQTEDLKNTAAENIAKERKIQDNLRWSAQMVGKAQEAERKRIARELHDETIQALIVVIRHVDDMASGESKLSAEDIRQEVRQILEGVRQLSQELRPVILDDLGLVPAIMWLASDMTKNYGIVADTNIRGTQRQLSPESELMLFRIAQEALNNVRKHSRATEVAVSIDFSERNIKITFKDNGSGFEKPSRLVDMARTGRLGLAGMQERVMLLGGTLNIDSESGKGTTLTVEVPLP